MQNLIPVALFLHILVASVTGSPTEEEVDAVIERADAAVRSAYSYLASERYSGRRAVTRRGRKITKE